MANGSLKALKVGAAHSVIKLDDTFAALRQLLAAHSKRLTVIVDKPGDYQVGSPTMKDRIGRPLFVAAVQTRKNYVSYHLMPVYMRPELLRTLSPTELTGWVTVNALVSWYQPLVVKFELAAPT